MLNHIREMNDGQMMLAIVIVGLLFWLLCALACYGTVWLKETMAYRCIKLKRENARLRKYISELRRECLCGKSK